MRSVRYRPDDLDPRDSLTRLSIPGLWLFGGLDQSIPVALSVVRLDELRSVGHQRFEYRVYPSVGHADIDEAVLRDLSSWIEAIAGSATTGADLPQTGGRELSPGPGGRESSR